jgi:cyclic beta-1,2-glucan synthetase
MARYMAPGPLGSAVAALLVVLLLRAIPWCAMPLLALWVSSPAFALWISREPAVLRERRIGSADLLELRQIARSTWRYFESFVTPEDNGLPPDNFQEDPQPRVAHRTSPTNIGLYLLSTLSARDFGWIGLADACERLEHTLHTMSRLQRHRGHFFNWYDTVSLRPLEPKYVSTVDSGNLAAHLLAVANAAGAWAGEARGGRGRTDGAADAIGLARRAVDLLARGRAGAQVLRWELDATLRRLEVAFGPSPIGNDADLAALGEGARLADSAADIARALAAEATAEPPARHDDVVFWTEAIGRSLRSQALDLALEAGALESLQARLGALASAARRFAFGMDFTCLFNEERRLLSIGLVATNGALDAGCYDLLASEARLAVFVAVAKRDVSARAWFRLGRGSAPAGAGTALLSWSGSMFEYLMPSLVMHEPTGSLLWQSNRMIVQRQMEYAAGLGIPWGISESAYNARDLEFTYQYSNFGVPGLGLKRGLGGDVVIAPYATALAAMVQPEAAVQNFRRLDALGARGRHGYYEAIDFTRRRLPDGADYAVVHAYMAHHQGMTVVAIANVVLDGRMRERFHVEPAVEAAALLLQERPPRYVTRVHPRADGVDADVRPATDLSVQLRRVRSPHDALPQTQLLSNGRYAVMITAVGSGYTRWNGVAVTRWVEDATRDDQGTYMFLRDVVSGQVWSAGYQPCGVEPDAFEATFSEDRALISRADGGLVTTSEVIVSPEYDGDVRRVTVTNKGFRVREIEFTTYTELALAPPAADIAHPAFLKLFVSTEHVRPIDALLATRRPRSPDEAQVWIAQHAVVEGEQSAPAEVETDRARFMGRGRELRDALALRDPGPLSETVGTVLDPIFAFRHRLRILPGGSVRIALWTLVEHSREAVLGLLDKHRDPNAFARASTLAWTRAQVQLRHLGVEPAEAILFQRLAGHLLYVGGAMRPASDVLQRGIRPPQALWANGISGDHPILLLRVYDLEDMPIVRQLLRAHEYWRTKQLVMDLVILNEHGASYVQDLATALATAVRMSQWRPRTGGEPAAGSVYVLRADLISEDAQAVLGAVARVVLNAAAGSLEDQLERARLPAATRRAGTRADAARRRALVPAPVPVDLEFFNGFGGFASNGTEYVTLLGGGQDTPMPWINVISNPNFGFQVSAAGGGYTWSRNSSEYKLTPWSNDPVSDRPGEVLYVTDELTGEVWGPTPGPTRDGGGHHRVTHGHGYTRFEHTSHGIALDLLQFVPTDDPVKISRLRVSNESRQPRKLSVTAYVEWVLGATRSRSAATVVTAIDGETGALLARNPWNADFGTRVAFLDLGGVQTQWSGDRREFLGRHGTLASPAGLQQRGALSGRVGAGLDPCGVLRAVLQLEPGASIDVCVLLGDAATDAQARELVVRYRAADVDAVLSAVRAHWNGILDTVRVTTPDRAFDLLMNRWAMYQAIACRLFARSAFYQASGAYGFRDQLQDAMAVVAVAPALAREHVLRAVGRQFGEGDVQHWWHAHSGQGVRTRISDDPVWLAHAVAHVVRVTGDAALLEVRVPFLEGRALAADESDAYFRPSVGDATASVYEHCARALDRSLAVGAHGLPLIGTGDWNDGMNLVGSAGRGESTWLGWLLYSTLGEFLSIAQSRGDGPHVEAWGHHRDRLRGALESAGWDGEWYRRGYYDDGATLGSAVDAECQIDAIAQSWSVISGGGVAPHPRQAMLALDRRLLDRPAALALLFTPPFADTPREPGYIKGYPAGIRENGDQYSHATAWTVLALGLMGEGDRALEVMRMVNPVTRASSRADVVRYKVEPYVVAADVYSRAPHVGRGGWTWYTGAAGCIHRAGLEGILGLRRRGERLLLAPALPRRWPRADVELRCGAALYRIAILNPHQSGHGLAGVEIDGVAAEPGTCEVSITDDGREHRIEVTLGPAPPAG